MKKSDKKQLVLATIVILFLFIVFAFFGFFYNFYNDAVSDNINYKLVSDFGDSNNMYIENILPVSSTVGKRFDGVSSEVEKQGYKEFSIENVYDENISYFIYLKKVNVCDEEINDAYIMLYLTDLNDIPLTGFEKKILPTYSSLSVLSDDASARLLYSDIIDANSKEKYKLRVWVSDLYSLNKDDECFAFDIYVRTK